MRITAHRADGALYLSLGGGLAVILKGPKVSRTLDETVVEGMGPWTPSTDNSFETRRATQRLLDLAHVSNLDTFLLYGTSEGASKGWQTKKDSPGGGAAKAMVKGGTATASAPDATPDAEPTASVPVPTGKGHLVVKAKPVKGVAVKAVPIPQAKGKHDVEVKQHEEGDVEVKPHEDSEPSEAIQVHVPTDDDQPVEEVKVHEDDEDKKATTLAVPQFDQFKALTLAMAGDPVMTLQDKSEHPFTYCKEHIIPAMADKGHAPDDPDAFCAWWKNEGPGSE